MAKLYTARMQVRLYREGEQGSVRILDQLRTAQRYFASDHVHLRVAEKAVPVPLVPYVASATAGPAYHLIATNRPGVVARIAERNTTKGCHASGYLCPVSGSLKSQVQTGLLLPVWDDAAGSWIDNGGTATAGYEHVACAKVTDVDENLNAAGTVMQCAITNRTTGVARFCFGTDDYVDLGDSNDGKIFSFWVYIPFTATGLTTGQLMVGSYPFDTQETPNESDNGTLGTPQDIQMARNAPTGANVWSAAFQTRTLYNRWVHVRVNKGDFTGSNNPVWNRITYVQLHFQYGGVVTHNVRFGNIYFGDPPESLVDSVALIGHRHNASGNGKTAVLSLDAPLDGDADVWVMAVMP